MIYGKHDLNEDFFANLYRTMPDRVTREEASRLIGGILKPRTIANLENGRFPKFLLPKSRLGKKVVYDKKDFIPWLKRVLSYTPNPVPRMNASRIKSAFSTAPHSNFFDTEQGGEETLPEDFDPRRDYNFSQPARTREHGYESGGFQRRDMVNDWWPF